MLFSSSTVLDVSFLLELLKMAIYNAAVFLGFRFSYSERRLYFMIVKIAAVIQAVHTHGESAVINVDSKN